MMTWEWYGLYCDDILISVRQFSQPPAIWDFMTYHSKENKYDVVKLEIVPVRPVKCE